MQKTLNPLLILKMKRIFSKLNERIKYIDSGGCGVFAVFLAKLLRRHGYDARIIALNRYKHWSSIYDEDDNTVTNHNMSIKHAMKKSNYVDVTKSHYVVRVGNFYIDNWDIVKTKGQVLHMKKEFKSKWHFKILLGNVPIPYLAYLNEQEDAWNSLYDRRNNRKLELFLKQHLSPILKEYQCV